MAEIPEIDGFSEAVRVARGGFAVVYRARQDRFDRVVALKVLDADNLDERTQRRFERECRVMGSLSWHPNVVAVLDSGVADGHPWMAMEFLDAGSLADRLGRDGSLPWAEVVDIGIQVAGALGAAHASGVLHRDLKPENLLVGPFGETRLADFGIAAVEGGTRTTTGHASFTVAHVAPEILEGKPPDERSDVYGFASTLHTLIAGRPPLAGEGDESIAALITRVLQMPAPRLVDVPESLADLVVRGLAKDPAERLATAEAFGQALQAVQAEQGLPATALRLAPTSGTGAVAVAAVTGDPDATRGPPVAPPPAPDAATVARARTDEPVAEATTRPVPPAGDEGRPGRGRRIGIGVGIAVVLAVIAAVVVSAGGGGSDGPEVAATIDVGLDPRDVVTDDGSVWVTTYEDNRIDRIDPESDDATATEFEANGPQGITEGGRALWVGNYSDGTLSRIDPGSGEETDVVSLGSSSPQDVSATDEAVWVALLDDVVARVEIEDLYVSALIPVCEGPQSISATREAVWVTCVVDDSVVRIDPDTNAVDETISVGSGPLGVATTDDAVWVAISGDGTVARIDPATNEVTETIEVGRSPTGVAAGEDAVWVTNTEDGTVSRIDPATNEVTDTIPVGHDPLGLTVDAETGAVWVANADDDTVTRIDF